MHDTTRGVRTQIARDADTETSCSNKHSDWLAYKRTMQK